MLVTQGKFDGAELDCAVRVLRDSYGLAGRVERLPGERDLNFQVRADDGDRYVLKLHAVDTDATELDLQDAALAYLSNQDGPPLAPRLVPTRDGQNGAHVHWIDGERRARLLTWLHGRPWAHVEPTTMLMQDLGRCVATVDRGLQGLTHPRMARELLWNITSAPQVAAMAPAVSGELRPLVLEVFERYEVHVEPKLAALPHQVIHNDANELNILVGDAGVAGLIDFGDVVWCPRICGLAVAAAYAMQGQVDPVRAILPLVAGYDEVLPLLPAELEVLFDLIRTRLAMSICMSATQHSRDPDNEYLLVSQPGVAEVLGRLAGMNPDLAHFRFRDAVGFEANPTARAVRQHFEAGVVRPGTVMDIDLAGVHMGRYGEVLNTSSRSPVDHCGRSSLQLGCSLFVGQDTAVHCPISGIVHSVTNDRSSPAQSGAVVIEHRTADGLPYWTRYARLDPASVDHLDVGDDVAVGDDVGRVGAHVDGADAGPYLYLQLLTHVFGPGTGVPEQVTTDEADLWMSVSVDPNLLLGRENGVAARPPRDAGGIAARRRTNFSRAMSIAYREPLHIVRGEGAYLFDTAGRSWLDLVNNVCHVGHGHPRVVAAAHRQAALLNTNTRYLHESIVDYSRRLVELLPDPLRVCFFVNSGSEANDLALRLARTHTGAIDTLVLDHAYHGNLLSQIALSPYKFNRRGGTGRPEHTHVCELPDPYRGRLRAGRDSDLGPRYADSVAQRLAALRAAGRRPAAFFVESLQSCGGQIVYPDGYLKAAFDHVRHAGGLCVADEVQVGLGRVGRHFWGFEFQGVVPDIVTMGKPMGNGHPLAAVVTTPEVARSFATGMEWFNTFGGNPVSAEVGLAVLDVIRDERLQARARERGADLLSGLQRLRERHPLLGDVRGEGLFIGIELSLDGRLPATAEAAAVKEGIKARGVLISTDGPDENVLKIKPPLVLSAADCDLFLSVLDDALTEVEQAL